MYICSCYAVTDGAIRAAIESGVNTFAKLAKTTRIATNCGICGREAKRIFYEIQRKGHAQALPSAAGDGEAVVQDSLDSGACSTPCGRSGGCTDCAARITTRNSKKAKR